MATTIAVSGKGGSGKTTIAAMIIRYLLKRGNNQPLELGRIKPAFGRAVLAVDADPNSCLAMMLGVKPTGTISEIREAARSKTPSNTGVDKLRTFEYGIQQAITEAEGFDLLTMGRPEGPDCYCAVNNMLRQFLDRLSSQYQFVVIDNEAGMEHLSRRTTNNVDLLCIVAEPNPLGTLTAQRIFKLAQQLPILVKDVGIIWNENRDPSPGIRDPRRGMRDSIEIFGTIPYDETVFDMSMQNKAVFDFQDSSAAFLAVKKIIESKLNLKSIKSEV
jgi:CO dehydrogenase maturation factor